MLFSSRFHRTCVLSVALLVAPVIAAPNVAAADQTYAATIADARAGLAEVMAGGAVDSISFSITDANGLIWTGADGKIDADAHQPSADTRYGIGSVSKVFTAAAIMQLVDAGKVDLDQPVVKYLPQFTMASSQYRQITVRMLLNHTAGLPGTDVSNAFTTKPFPGYAKQALATLAKSTLKTTPGALAVYCNDCFTVAGEVVAAVSGMPYTAYVESKILQPLGMTNSSFITAVMPQPGTVARTFDGDAVAPQEVTNLYATGGLVSTPTDMAIFARALLGNGSTGGGRMLTARSVAEMARDQIATTLAPGDSTVITLGLGWDDVHDAKFASLGVRVLSKNGATGDYNSNFLIAPEAGLAVFVNAAGHKPGAGVAVGRLSQRILAQALLEKGAIRALPKAVTEQPPTAAPSADDIDAMVGIYAASASHVYRVTRGAGDALFLEQLISGTWKPATTLTLRSDGAWWAPAPAMLAYRSITGWGRNYLALEVLVGNGAPTLHFPLAQRVAPAGPIAADWKERIGKWVVISERPESMSWRVALPVTELTAIPGLPGYIVFAVSTLNAESRIATMFAQVPQNNGRDQSDLVPEAGGLLRFGSLVVRPLASIPTVARGTTSIPFDKRGYAVLLRIPTAGTLQVRNATEWKLYREDTSLQAAGTATTVSAPKGSTLVLFGKPAQRVTITR